MIKENDNSILDEELDFMGDGEHINVAPDFFMICFILANKPFHAPIFLNIVNSARKDNSMLVDVKQLAEDLILKETQIFSALNYFVKNKLIKRGKREGDKIIYYLNSQIMAPEDGSDGHFSAEVPIGFGGGGLKGFDFSRF